MDMDKGIQVLRGCCIDAWLIENKAFPAWKQSNSCLQLLRAGHMVAE